MNGELGLGASGGASQQTSGGLGFSGLDGFGRCPLHTGLVGWGGMWSGVMADVEAGQNETAAYDGGGSGGPAAVVLGASCKEDGSQGDGRSLEMGVEVRTGAFAEEGVVSGPSAAWAGQASSGGSGRSALDMLAAPRKLDAPRRLFAPDRPEAPQVLFVLCRLDAAHRLFVPGRLDAAHTLAFLGKLVALGTFVALQKLFAPHRPSAPHMPVAL